MNFGDKNSTKNVGYSCQQALKLIAGLVLFEIFVYLVKCINKLKGHCKKRQLNFSAGPLCATLFPTKQHFQFLFVFESNSEFGSK